MDDLSQEPSSLLDKESKPETSPSNGESSSIEAQGISNVIVPKVDSVDSTDISITESQFSSTMPYCKESLGAKLCNISEYMVLMQKIMILQKLSRSI